MTFENALLIVLLISKTLIISRKFIEYQLFEKLLFSFLLAYISGPALFSHRESSNMSTSSFLKMSVMKLILQNITFNT